jgi:hypothetical protein
VTQNAQDSTEDAGNSETCRLPAVRSLRSLRCACVAITNGQRCRHDDNALMRNPTDFTGA